MKKIVLTLLLTLIGISQNFAIVEASELNFAVEAIIPENQRDKSKTYFDLRIAPNVEQTIEINLRNDTEKDIIVEPSVNSSTTNLNGVIEYGETKIKQDSTLLIDLKKIVSVPKEVVVPANDAIKVPLKIKMPATKFDGILSGGITIKEKDTAIDTNKSNNQGLAINNKYAYVVALLINQTDKEIVPNLKLNSVLPAQVNARNVINANIQNIESAYVNAMNVSAKVTKKGSSEVLYRSNKKNMQMAPNTNFYYPISLDGKKLEAGEYTLTLDAKAKEGKWKFTKNFTINSEDANKYNQSDVSIKKDNSWIYILILVFLLALISLLLFFIWKQKKKKEQKRQEEARRRKIARLRKKRKQRLENNKKNSV